MKIVNWRYPTARVFLRYDKGRGFEKAIRRAVGVIVGRHFIGWMRADTMSTPVGWDSDDPNGGDPNG